MTTARDRRRTLDGFGEINHDASGIDVGNAQHWVAVPAGRDVESVRMFGCFTADLHALANWLERCGIKTVAMESTGVDWIALYEVLESRGFKVCVVNARQAKNLPGRKTDVKDCQWSQQLHTYGLRTASFRPQGEIIVSFRPFEDQLAAIILIQVQGKRYLGDAAGLTSPIGEPDRAVVGSGDLLRKDETNPRTAWLCRVERHEEIGFVE
jgi:hypothetical protein